MKTAKVNILPAGLLLMLLFSASISYTAESPATDSTPVAVMPETAFEFPPAIEGDSLTHDFLIQNRGNAPLTVKEVKTTCGCTTASIPGPILPGGEGLISINLSTRGTSGENLNKTATVFTNDPKKKEIPLSLKVYVEKIYTLTPENVVLKGIEGEAVKQTVSLVPGKAFPFAIKEVRAKRGENIKYQFEEIKEGKSVRYELTVENTRKVAGVYFDTLFLKTDNARKPEIQITIFGNISKTPDQPAQKPVG